MRRQAYRSAFLFKRAHAITIKDMSCASESKSGARGQFPERAVQMREGKVETHTRTVLRLSHGREPMRQHIGVWVFNELGIGMWSACVVSVAKGNLIEIHGVRGLGVVWVYGLCWQVTTIRLQGLWVWVCIVQIHITPQRAL